MLRQIASVPPGRWGVGVSGGADSVALLLLLCSRPQLHLHVIHLDHETRGKESAADAVFVANLARLLNRPATIQRRSVVEFGPTLTNLSSRYRQARMALFRKVVAAENLDGVILAHHAGDQAETVLQRLLRGSGATGLAGIKPKSVVDGLTILRPLLEVQPAHLREFLHARNQIWREDASNASDDYLRNRLRRWLAGRHALQTNLVQLASESAKLRDWLDQTTPVLAETFPVDQLAELPPPIARHAAAKWLTARGSPFDEISQKVCDRLIEMATDAASQSRQDFPGGFSVGRKKGMMMIVGDAIRDARSGSR